MLPATPFYHAITDEKLQKAYFEAVQKDYLINCQEVFILQNLLFVWPETFESLHYQRPVFRIKHLKSSITDAPTTLASFFPTNTYLYGEFSFEAASLPYSYGLVQKKSLQNLGFRLVETRLHYVHTKISHLTYNAFKTRQATSSDESWLREIAANQRNDFDRHHAEPTFSQKTADAYLAQYASSALRGFCTGILVPSEPLKRAFVAYTIHKKWAVVVPQVGASQSKGAFYELLYNILLLGQQNDCKSAYANTQLENTACQKALMRLGFNYTHQTEIWAWSS